MWSPGDGEKDRKLLRVPVTSEFALLVIVYEYLIGQLVATPVTKCSNLKVPEGEGLVPSMIIEAVCG